MKLGGQTFENVHDVHKVCLEMSLCFFSCFIEFCVVFWMKLIWDILNSYTEKLGFETSGKTSPRPSKDPWGRTFPLSQGCLGPAPINWDKCRLVVQSNTHQLEEWVNTCFHFADLTQPTEHRTVRLLTDVPLMGNCLLRPAIRNFTVKLKGELVNSANVQIRENVVT